MGNLFFRNPRLTILTILLVGAGAIGAIQRLPRQEDPTLSRRMGTITTFYPGASALHVESLVTEKIEAEVLELHEIEVMQSLSRTGISVINLELGDAYDESSVDEVWSKVRDRIANLLPQLPAGALPPEVEDKTTTAVTLAVALIWEQDDAPQVDILSRLAADLEDRLRILPGTKETELFGEAEEEIRVTASATTLAALEMTVEEVARGIAAADTKIPAGAVRRAPNDLRIEVSGELDSLARVRKIPLRQAESGHILRVRDVARVEKETRAPPRSLALVDNRRAVVVAATMEPMRRVDRWTDAARSVVDEFEREIPTGIRLRTIFDQSVYTEERLATLAGNLLLGALIVVVVLFFMMGARSAFVVASALPLALGAALAELNIFGVPLHQTSTTGLIIALGLLVDNAIVVVDEYAQHARRGTPPSQAIATTIHELFVPLLASTLTTVFAFLPIVLMPGNAGEFVGPISIGVSFCVLSSLFFSLTVIPALAGYFIGTTPATAGSAWWQHGYSNARLRGAYGRVIDTCLRRPWLGIGVSLILPIAGFAVGSTLTEQFFPANDRNQFQIQINTPSQTSLAETQRHVERARALVDAHDEVLESQWFIGEAPPRVFYNTMLNEDGITSFAGAFVTTRSAHATEALLPDLQQELRQALPQALIMALPFEQGPPFDAPIEVRLLGPDLEKLRSLGEEVRGLLAQTTRVTYTRARLSGGEPKLLFRADEDAARGAALRLTDIARQLEDTLEGVTGGSILEGTEEIDVRVRVDDTTRGDLARVDSLYLQAGAAPAAASATRLSGPPLTALAQISLVPELAAISRYDGQRANIVQAYLQPYALIAESLSDFRQRLEASDFRLPPGYSLHFGGEDERRGEAMSRLSAFALPLFVAMAGIIVLSFNSFRMAGIIFVVAFLSVGLALFGVWAFGHPMGFIAIIGTMGLVGLAINDSIVILAALRADAEACAGDVDAAREVVLRATRHILSTTLTTVGGFLPLIIWGGRFWPPMATAIAGGVVGSSILALFLVPSTFILMARRG